MKKFSKFIAIAIVGALSLASFTGCSSSSTAESPSQTTQTETTTTESTPTTDEVADATLPTQDREGNPIVVPDTINRIVSTAPSNTEVLVDLGLGSKLVGIDKWSNDIEGIPADITLIDFQNPDAEALIGLNPDIIIASGHNRAGSEDPFALLKEAGITVVYLPTSDSIEGIYEDIRFLGNLTGTSDKATEIISDLESRVAHITKIAEQVTTPKTVYFEVSPAPYITAAGNHTFLNDFIHLAGAVNIFADQEPWFSPSPEAIIEANPDVIIINSDYIENPIEEIKSREGWDIISAIQNDNVYLIDANESSRASHHSVKALEAMAKVIYPELYE